jgi:hypothetical protein
LHGTEEISLSQTKIHFWPDREMIIGRDRDEVHNPKMKPIDGRPWNTTCENLVERKILRIYPIH